MNQEYIARIEKIEKTLQQYLPENPDAVWIARVFPGLEKKISPHMARTLIQPGWDLVNRGGKRWRPLLMLLLCESLGGGDLALPLAPLVEFPHNASLIHDDIEDNSDERRGKPAVHIIYGTDTGINGGCFLYFLPLLCIDNWEFSLAGGQASSVMPERKNQVFSVWGDFLRRLHLGQAMDIRWHRDFYSLPSLDEYYTMCSLKTGCLARLAAVLGVSAAFSSPVPHTVEMRDVEKSLMERFGTAAEKLGVGFQILDDVKNLVSGVPGKKRGDDIVEGKKSLPVLLYLHQKPEKMEFTSRCFTAARKGGSSVPEVEKLITELSSGGFLKKAEEKGQALIREAQEQFSSNFPKPAASSETENARKLLAGLTDLIS